jgi:transcription-repair coupling factor (superfamily II helicase)
MDELVDRFGEPPAATRNLLRIALIHTLAVKCRITSIRQAGGEIHIYPQKFDVDVWSELSALFGRLRVIMSGEPHICMRLQKGDDALALIHKMFEKYLEIRNEKA